MSRGTVKLPPADSELARLVESMCDGAITPAEGRRLESLLAGDREAQLFYVAYLDLHAQVQWMTRGNRNDECGMMNDEFPAGTIPGDVHPSSFIPHPSDAPEPLIPPIIIHASPFSPPPSLVGSWLFSYGVATLLMGVAVLISWVWKVSHDYSLDIAKNSRELTAPGDSLSGAVSPRLDEPQYVGRISGTAGCRWADPRTAPGNETIPLGRKYELASGLLEISYQSGAKVILQGPCTYEVESAAAGYLSLGKLTAKIEKSEIRNPKSEGSDPSSFIPHPSSLFVVRTPTVVITDLGTEFGVEVDQSGGSRTHVFRGKVELRLRGHVNGARPPVPLGENESAQVEAGKDRSVRVVRERDHADAAGRFARQLPHRVPIKFWNTGIGLKEGDPDPHWQIVARSDDPKFKPRPAVVTRVKEWHYGRNEPAQSQWISTAGDLPDLPNGVTYTFRTTFELRDAAPETAFLRGWFLADNHVNAIRLNGKELTVPEHGYSSPFTMFHKFLAHKGFVEGTNVLEIDVYNGGPPDNPEPFEAGPMALHVDLEGAVVGGSKTPPDAGRTETTDSLTDRDQL